MPPAAPAAPPATVPKKGPNPQVSALKKGMEKADAAQKALRGKVKDLREGGRAGRAVVDTTEAALAGAVVGFVDGIGVGIPIGEARAYAWTEAELGADGKPTGKWLKPDGTVTGVISEAAGFGEPEIDQFTIPLGLPVGLALVAGGAMYDQADAMEFGKAAVATSVGLMTNRLGKGVRALFRAA